MWDPEVRVGYIDGDLLVYSGCAKFEEEETFDPLERYLDKYIDDLTSRLHLDDWVIFVTGGDNFRKEIYPEYKAHRKKKEKPKWLTDAYKYLYYKQGAKAERTYEADDLLGIALTDDPDGLLMSYDKDLDQIPGWHYNWYRDEMYYIGQGEAEWFLARQALAGDMTDNIPGIKGIGPKKAEAILGDPAPFSVYLERVVEAYYEKGYEFADFAKYYKCLKILRTPEQEWPELQTLPGYTNKKDT